MIPSCRQKEIANGFLAKFIRNPRVRCPLRYINITLISIPSAYTLTSSFTVSPSIRLHIYDFYGEEGNIIYHYLGMKHRARSCSSSSILSATEHMGDSDRGLFTRLSQRYDEKHALESMQAVVFCFVPRFISQALRAKKRSCFCFFIADLGLLLIPVRFCIHYPPETRI